MVGFIGGAKSNLDALVVDSKFSQNGYGYGYNFPGVDASYSYAGVDAVATIVVPEMDDLGNLTGAADAIELGELQTISYSIHRENSPIRTVGNVNPKGFIKGGRTIAGSLVFTVFREYAFYRLKNFKKFLSGGNKGNQFFAPLADMLPPFDIIVTFFDEFGGGSKMKIFGVTIVDEGQTVSIDDLLTEQTYTYMARGIQPMIRLANSSIDKRTAQEYGRDIDISNNVFGDKVVDEYSAMFDSASIKLDTLNNIR